MRRYIVWHEWEVSFCCYWRGGWDSGGTLIDASGVFLEDICYPKRDIDVWWMTIHIYVIYITLRVFSVRVDDYQRRIDSWDLSCDHIWCIRACAHFFAVPLVKCISASTTFWINIILFRKGKKTLECVFLMSSQIDRQFLAQGSWQLLHRAVAEAIVFTSKSR